MLKNTTYMDALNGVQTNKIPVWFMRQAGRSLPEYRNLKGDDSILKILEDPEKSAAITLQPVERHGVDAAVLYSDIMMPLIASGVDIEIQEGVGPVLKTGFTSKEDLNKIDTNKMGELLLAQKETIKIVKSKAEVPLIGFVGAPFTLACYLIDGRPTKNWTATQKLLLTDQSFSNSLFKKLAQVVIKSIDIQVNAGVDAIQIFDSWAGILEPRTFSRYLINPLRDIIAFADSRNIPITYFGLQNLPQLPLISQLSPGVVSIDSTMEIQQAKKVVGSSVGIQGNLNPVSCLASFEYLKNEITYILEQGFSSRTVFTDESNRSLTSGYIFNLGHGVLPATDPNTLTQIVKLIHEFNF